jgi:hypothetical protein
MYTVYAAQVYEDAVADVSSSSSGSNSSGAVAMQQLDCAGYFARGLVLLARQKVCICWAYACMFAHCIDIDRKCKTLKSVSLLSNPHIHMCVNENGMQ